MWPKKHEIKPADVTLWRKAIESLCALQLHLSVPLGLWKMQQSDWTLNLDWFSSTTADKIFHQNKDRIWTEYAIKEGRRRTQYFHNISLELTHPPSEIKDRISIKLHKHVITIWSRCTLTENGTDIPPLNRSTSIGGIKKFLQRIDNKPWISEVFETSASISILLRDFQEGKVLAVSNGSFYKEFKVRAAAWKFQSNNGTIPGHPEAQSSFCSKLGGLVGIGMVAMALATSTESSPTLDLGCDGAFTLLRNNLPSLKVSCSMKDYNIISILSKIWEKSTDKVNAIEVRGHQDDLGRELTVMETMNIDMDNMAKTIVLRVQLQRIGRFRHQSCCTEACKS